MYHEAVALSDFEAIESVLWAAHSRSMRKSGGAGAREGPPVWTRGGNEGHLAVITRMRHVVIPFTINSVGNDGWNWILNALFVDARAPTINSYTIIVPPNALPKILRVAIIYPAGAPNSIYRKYYTIIICKRLLTSVTFCFYHQCC